MKVIVGSGEVVQNKIDFSKRPVLCTLVFEPMLDVGLNVGLEWSL